VPFGEQVEGQPHAAGLGRSPPCQHSRAPASRSENWRIVPGIGAIRGYRRDASPRGAQSGQIIERKVM